MHPFDKFGRDLCMVLNYLMKANSKMARKFSDIFFKINTQHCETRLKGVVFRQYNTFLGLNTKIYGHHLHIPVYIRNYVKRKFYIGCFRVCLNISRLDIIRTLVILGLLLISDGIEVKFT